MCFEGQAADTDEAAIDIKILYAEVAKTPQSSVLSSLDLEFKCPCYEFRLQGFKQFGTVYQ